MTFSLYIWCAFYGDADRLCGAAGEGDQAVKGAGVRAGLDRVIEASASPACWGDDGVGSAQNVRAEFVGHGDLLTGGLGEVPCVHQELDRENTQDGRGGHLAWPNLDGAVGTAGVPCFHCRLGRFGEPCLKGARGSAGELSPGGAAQNSDRSDEVIGQLRDREFGAGGGAPAVGFRDAAQDLLTYRQSGLGGRQCVERSEEHTSEL